MNLPWELLRAPAHMGSALGASTHVLGTPLGVLGAPGRPHSVLNKLSRFGAKQISDRFPEAL